MTSGEGEDYCECGRGVVVGLLGNTDSRVWVLDPDRVPHLQDEAADLRCLDCVADVVSEVMSGRVRERMAG